MPAIKTIGILAPSLPTVGKRAKAIREAMRYLRKEGFLLKIGQSVFQKQAFRSSDIRVRVKDLMDFFADPEVNCILTTTGGYNSNEMLEFLDYSIIRKNPKWLIGYSDVTVLNLGLMAKAGTPTVNGPMLVDHLHDPTALRRLVKSLKVQTNGFPRTRKIWESKGEKQRSAPRMKCLPGKRLQADGRIIAGNLSSFVLLLGTEYMPDLKNALLFLEYDVCEDKGLPSIERMLWQIRQAGIFQEISGLIFGILPKAVEKETTTLSIEKILQEVTDNVDCPIVFNAPFGHLYPSWILKNNSRAALKTTRSGDVTLW